MFENSMHKNQEIPAQPIKIFVPEQNEKMKSGLKKMSNGHVVQQYFRRFIQLEIKTCMAFTLNILLIYVYYELDFQYQNYLLSQLLLGSLLIILLFEIFLVVLKKKTYNDWKRSELNENETDIWCVVWQILILIVQPYPFLNQLTFYVKNYSQNEFKSFKVNYLLTILAIFRIAFIISSFLFTSKFLTPRSIRICKMYGSQPSFLYIIKCLFKQSSIFLITFWFGLSLVIFSFAFRVSERGMDSSSHLFNYYSNTIWLAIITMTTVGYGDMAPVTEIGRIVGLTCVFWGGFTVSVMVVVLTNTLNLDQRQKRALVILKRLQLKKQARIIAAQYIKVTLWRVWKNYKAKKQNTGQYIEQGIEQRKLKKNFQLIHRVARMNLMDVDLYEDMTRHFERVQAHICHLKKNAQNLITYITEQYFTHYKAIDDDNFY